MTGNDINSVTLNLPDAPLQFRSTPDGATEVFDITRSRWIAFTPEERVRQHFVNYLVNHLGYPLGRIGNEISISLNKTVKRCDTVVYDDSGKALMIVEYKAPQVAITRDVFEQIMRYALALDAPWLVVSNGIRHFCARAIKNPQPSLRFVNAIPGYDSLATPVP